MKLLHGNKYLLKNVNDDFAPENITLKRVGNALHVIQEGDTQPSIIIEDYFNGDANNPVLLGMAEDGQLYSYIPISGEGYETGYLIADGELSPVALGGESLGSGSGIFAAADDDNDMLFGFLGWLAAAAAIGGIAAAIADDDDDDHHSAPNAPSIGEVMDNTGSITGPIKSGDVTDETKPVMSGTGNPGNTVTIYDNGKAIGSTTVGDDGKWTFTPETPLGEGKHAITVTETDSRGSTSEPSAPIDFDVDTTAPAAPTIEHIMDKVGDITGEINNGGATDDAKPEISGTGEVGATVTIYDNGKVIGQTEVNSDGRWYFIPETALADGQHKITVTQTDKAGNVSDPSDIRDFNVITGLMDKSELPEILDNTGSITGPLHSGDVTDETKPTFNGDGTPGNTIIIEDNGKVIGSTVVDDDGKWTFIPETPLDEGKHELVVSEKDPAGNTSDRSDPIEIEVDTTPPNKPDVANAQDNTGSITGPIQNGGVTDETKPVFSGGGEPGDKVTIYDGDKVLGTTTIDENGKWTFTPDEALSEGDHSITVTQSDPAGNVSESSDPLEFEVDTTPPNPGEDVLKITGVEDNVGDKQGNVASGDTTDDSQPVISGIGEAGNTVYVYSTDAAGKHLIGSAIVNGEGKWSLTPDTPLLEGLNQLTLESSDPAGNRIEGKAPSYDVNILIPVSTEPSIGSVVDNVEPHTGPLQKGDVTNDSTPTLSGAAAPGDIVTIKDNGQPIGSVVADENGKWSFTPETGLKDGNHNLTVTATDAAGNSKDSGSFPIVIDTVPPKPAENIVIEDNVGDKQGEVKDGDTTDDRTPTLNGEAEPGSTVTIIDNGEVIGTATVDDDGKWTFTPETPLDKGDHEITTEVTDPAGNTSEPTPGITITVDPEPNEVIIGAVKDDQGPITGNVKPGGVTDDARPEITGEGKPGSTVTVKDGDAVLGTTIVKPDGSWSFTPEEDLGEGEHSLTVVSTDPAGNEVTSPAFELTVDTESPDQPSIGSATDDVGEKRGELNNGDVTDDSTPTLKGEAEAGSRVDIYDNGELIGSVVADENGAWSFTPTTPLPEGEHKFTTTATDEAGNTSKPSEEFVLTTDYSPPNPGEDVLKITGVEDNVGDNQGNVASGDTTDDSQPVISGIGEAGNTVYVYSTDTAGKHLIGSAIVNGEGKWSLTPDTPLLEGLNQLTLESSDPAGNRIEGKAPSYDVNILIPVSTEPSIGSVVDNVEPHTGPLQKGDVTNDSTPTLSGAATPGDIVTIKDNGQPIGSVVADENGKWSFTPETGLKDGNHNLTVTATDAAGNSKDSGSFPIVIDTVPPKPAENIVIEDNVGDKQGEVKDGDTTDDRTPTLNGEAEPGSTVTIIDNGEVIGTATVDDDGKWTFTPETPLDKGDHEITTEVTDPAGNTSEPTPGITITVDPEPNEVIIGAVKDDQGPITGNVKPGGVTDDARPEITGEGKPGSTVTVKDGDAVLGTTIVKPDGSWSFTPEEDLGEGEHSLTVVSTDPAGNEVTSPAFELTVDTESPDQPSIGSATDDVGEKRGELNNGDVTDDSTPTLKGEAEAGSRVDIYDNGELIGSVVADENGAWSFTPTTPLPEGEHKFTTTATDEAGNTSKPSEEFVLTTDYSPPNPGEDVLKITGVEDSVGDKQGNVASGDTTDDSQPVISGIGEAGNTVYVYSTDTAGKHLIGSAIVNGEGKWSLTPDTPLLEGLNQLTLESSDPAGNRIEGKAPSYDINVFIPVSTEPSIGSVVDNVEPHTGPLQKGDVTNDSTPTLSGAAAPGDIVTIKDNGQPIGSVVADENGKWSFTPETGLEDGNHNLTVTATDAAGNNKDSGSFPIVIDTVPPKPAENIVIEDNVGDKQGEVKDGDTTDDASPTLNGEAEPGSTVTIIDNGEVIGTATVDDDGKWTFTPETPLGEGPHEITTEVTDPAGNTSKPSDPIVIEVDTTPVEVSIGSVIDDKEPATGKLNPGDVTNDTRPEITGEGKPGSTVTVKDGETVLGTTTVQPDGSWSFTPEEDLGEGEHSLTATATDKAGNEVTTPPFDLVVDTIAPEQPSIGSIIDDVGSITGELKNGGVTDDSNPTLNGTAEAGSIVTIKDGEKVLGSVTANDDGDWSFTPTTPLPEGEHKFTVTATDEAGNSSKPSDEFVLTLDLTPPDPAKLSITEVYDDYGSVTGKVEQGKETDDNRPTIKGTGAEEGNIITVYNGNKVIGSTKVKADGTWELEPETPLANGTYTFTAKETDPAGLTSGPSKEYAVIINGVPPAPPTLNSVYDDAEPNIGYVQKGDLTNDNTPTLSGTGLAGATITVYDNGKVIGTAAVDGTGNWKFTPDSALTDGKHNFTATQTDGVGRTSEPTGEFDIRIDATAPDAVKGLAVHDDVGDKTGDLQNGETTDDRQPTFSGTAEPGSTVNIIDNGKVIGTATVGDDGKWSFTPDAPLDNGNHDFTTTVTDEAGNTGPEGEHLTVKVDGDLTKATITKVVDDQGSVTGDIAQNGVTDDTRPQLVGTAKAGSIVTLWDGENKLGETTAKSDGSWSFTPSVDLGKGSHTLTAKAKDPMGNESTSNSWTLTIDTDAPVKPTIDGAYDDVGNVQGELKHGGATDDPTPTLNGKAEAGSTVKIYDQSGLIGSVTAKSDGSWSFTPDALLSEGKHTFYVTATDKAGNTSVRSDNFELTLDFTPPDPTKLSITEVYDDYGSVTGKVDQGKQTDDNRPTIKGTGAEEGN
ncbi:Ig-like domain-containing protein, partial [Enterobacillus tribolii]|uniref:Ig-like domain-containing protein n=1 Tax=Enterobacillus tribolii TaxID=1487935 RepID=UPI00289EA755